GSRRDVERPGRRRDRGSPDCRRADRPDRRRSRGSIDAAGGRRRPGERRERSIIVMTRTRVPAVEGWFTMDEAAPHLMGARGAESGSYFFPKPLAVSANPAAPFEARDDVLLSRRGRVWSYTTNHYEPPEPYVSPDPFVPYTVVAV